MTFEIKNLNNYRSASMQPSAKPVSIGIASPGTESDIYSQRLVKGVGTALARYTSEVVLPYSLQSAKKVDVIAQIGVKPEYKSSGWNFLINWPGFLIFMPAWNGYVYKVNYNVDILLTDGPKNSRIDSFSIPVHLNIRHADMDRTWTEVGWLEFGIIPLFGGIIFATTYDPDVSPLTLDKIESPVGDYIAQEIISRVNAYMRK